MWMIAEGLVCNMCGKNGAGKLSKNGIHKPKIITE
jgi:hypothetical protein